MTTSALVFLGVAAAAAFVQAVALIVLGFELRRTLLRVDALGARVASDLQPALANLTLATERAARASEVSLAQARRVDALFAEAALTLGNTSELARRVILPQVVRAVSLATAVKTVRKGLAFYRRFRRR
jgi:hypothetical protein